jgi:hypothetical protein
MFKIMLFVLMVFAGAELCLVCRGLGGKNEYRVQYEVHTPTWRVCPWCKGTGWKP